MERQRTAMLLVLMSCIALLAGIRVGYDTDWPSIGKPAFYMRVKEMMEDMDWDGAEVWEELPYRASENSYNMFVLWLDRHPDIQNSVLGMDLCYGSDGRAYITHPEVAVRISDKQVFLYRTIGIDLPNGEIGISKSLQPGEEICIRFNRKVMLEELCEQKVAAVLQPSSMIEKLCAKPEEKPEEKQEMEEKRIVLNQNMEKGTEYNIQAPRRAGNYRCAFKISGSESHWYYFFITVKEGAQ